jgi:hypothetical protein
MDQNLIQQMKQDIRYAAVNGCPPPSDKFRAAIQRLRDVTGRRCHIYPDGRHYQHDYHAHATFCEIYMHEETGILEYPNANDKYEDHDFVKSKGGVVWVLFIELSWLGDYAAYYWNVRRSYGKGEGRDCRVSAVKESRIPDSFFQFSNPLFDSMRDQGFLVFPYESLMDQVDWVDDLIDPTTDQERVIYGPDRNPTVDDLLFGSPGLYIDVPGLNF